MASGATVTFKNHASCAPVVWLVNGNVTIVGTVSLDGQQNQPPGTLAEPGPGGFRGGMDLSKRVQTAVLDSGPVGDLLNRGCEAREQHMARVEAMLPFHQPMEIHR